MRTLLIALCLCSVTACGPATFEQPAELELKDQTPGRATRGYGASIRSFPGAKIPFELVDKDGVVAPIIHGESVTPEIATVDRIEDGTIWVEAHATGTARVHFRIASGQHRTLMFKVNRLAKKSIQPLYSPNYRHSGRPALLGGGEVALVARFEGAAGNALTGVYDDIWTYEGDGVLSDPPATDVATYKPTDARGEVTVGTHGERRTFPVVSSHDVTWISLRENADRPWGTASCLDVGNRASDAPATSNEALIAMGTPTHDVWGDPADEFKISASNDAVIVRDSKSSRRFRVEYTGADPVEVTIEWRGLTASRMFRVCAEE